MITVHIHSFLLDSNRQLLDGASKSLPDDELNRAGQFKVDSARDEFLLSRLLLRQTLAGHLDMSADLVALAYNPFGKPRLHLSGQAHLEFNLSHSHGRLLIAVCQGLPIGVDIERIDLSIDPLRLASTGMSEAAVRNLRASADIDRHELFYRLWTRKEAYLKALGTGFMIPHEDPAEVEIAAGVLLKKVSNTDQHVMVRELSVAPGYRAAVALRFDGRPPLPLLASLVFKTYDDQ
jgi:4'-phosphopantetheinyl transferase